MATWKDLGDDSLNAAKRLRDHGHLRSAISRAYYSAYASASDALLRSGVDFSSASFPNASHPQLQQLVRHNLDSKQFPERVRKEAATKIRNLFRFRATADYDPASHISQALAVGCIRDAAWIVEQLRGVQK